MITNEILLYAQIGPIVLFVFTLFSIYKTLGESKDATNQVLKDNIALLKDKLMLLKEESPDVLVERYAKRVKLSEEELKRTLSDKEASDEQKVSAQKNLTDAFSEMNILRCKLDMANSKLDEYSCPYCRSELIERSFASESMEDDMGREHEVDHEWARYECGYSVTDGFVNIKCPNSAQRIRP